MFFRIFESPLIFTIHIRLSFALLQMDRVLIRKIRLDASDVPANIQEEETTEKGNGEEKNARENPEGGPVSEAGTSTEQQDKLTNAEPMKTSKQKQVNVFQKLPSVKGANRKLVRCSVCYRKMETAKIYAPKGKVPDICQELGVVSRARILDNHLQSKVHVECLKADFQSVGFYERAEILLFVGENVALKLNR